MAYKRELPQSESFAAYKLPFLYNLHGSVGWKSANRADDVMLVQQLLSIILSGNAFNVRSDYLPFTGNLPFIDVDGVFGPTTSFALSFFQVYMRAKIGSIKPTTTPSVSDPLCRLQSHAAFGSDVGIYESSFLRTAPPALQAALKTTRKS